VSECIQAEPEDLTASAAQVDGHADGLHVRHAAANGRIEAAQVGVPAGPAAALSTALAKWQTDTTALFGRLVDHSDGLRSAAIGYAGTDERNAAGIRAVGDEATARDSGL
jgi:uncharacterized protein YukE